MDLDLALTILSALAACFLSWRAFIRIHAMCRCTPILIRVSAWMMGTSALSIVFGALGHEHQMVKLGTTFALVSVAVHIVADKRPVTRSAAPARRTDDQTATR